VLVDRTKPEDNKQVGGFSLGSRMTAVGFVAVRWGSLRWVDDNNDTVSST
jgi:hypothetical protein